MSSLQARPRGRPTKQPVESPADRVYSALAHPQRRAMLDLLAQGPQRPSDVLPHFPNLSRQAVGAHLAALREAGLAAKGLNSAGDSREQLYRLEPEALAQVEQWLSRYRQFWAAGLARLEQLAVATPLASGGHASEPHLRMAQPERIELQDHCVLLEPLGEAHWPHFKAALGERALWRFSLAPMQTTTDMRAYFNAAHADTLAGHSVAYAVHAREGRKWQFAGSTRLANIDRRNATLEIGWTWLLPRFQRSGVNRAAKRLLLEYVFGQLGCRRVTFKGDVRNAQSRAALDGIGATFEGILRQHLTLPDGSQRDSFIYSIIAEEWPAVNSQSLAGCPSTGS